MFGCEAFAIGIICWRVGLHPGWHGGARGDCLPASAKAAGAFWAAGGIDYVVAEFGVGVIGAAVEMAVEEDASADAGADCDVDQARLVFACAPGGFSEGGGVGVVFEGGLDVEDLLQIRNNVLALPAGEEIHVSEFSGEGVDGAGAADADAGDCCVGIVFHFTKKIDGAV